MAETKHLDKNAFTFINYLKSIGQSFEMEVSNYTLNIYVEGEKHKYITESKTPYFFAAMNKIQKDVEFAVLQMGFSDHLINESITPKFYSSAYQILPFSKKEVFNIDLNSAYPTALYQLGLLSKETMDYLMRIPKIDRLAAVGCLAKHKNIYKYVNGILTETKQEISEFRNIWRLMVNMVDSLLRDLVNVDPENFVFYWVDGIFFKETPEKAKLAEMDYHIKECGFEYKNEKITNFELRRFDDKIRVEFDRVKPGKAQKHIEQTFQDPHFQGLRNYLTKYC